MKRYSIELRLCSDKRITEIQKIMKDQIVYLLKSEKFDDEFIGLYIKNEDTGKTLDKVVNRESA